MGAFHLITQVNTSQHKSTQASFYSSWYSESNKENNKDRTCVDLCQLCHLCYQMESTLWIPILIEEISIEHSAKSFVVRAIVIHDSVRVRNKMAVAADDRLALGARVQSQEYRVVDSVESTNTLLQRDVPPRSITFSCVTASRVYVRPSSSHSVVF